MCLRSTLLHRLVRVALLHLVALRREPGQQLPGGLGARTLLVRARLAFPLPVARLVLASGAGTHTTGRSSVNFEFAHSSQHLSPAKTHTLYERY